MKSRYVVSVIGLFSILTGFALADRELEQSEAMEILAHLTANPIETWIPAGQIEGTLEEYRAPKTTNEQEIQIAIREEIAMYMADPAKPERAEYLQKMRVDAIPFNVRYRLANESKETSNVVVKFDGDRFYWGIEVLSRTDSVKPGKELAGNFMTDQFDMEFSRKRVYAWNGQEYVRYSPLATHASIDAAERLPHRVNGPLTAGITPWGYGYYTYDNLSSLELSAVEKTVDGQTQIELTIIDPEGLRMDFVLDPVRDYAVLSRTDNRSGNTIKVKRYSDYRFVSGRWVPFEIAIEKTDVGSNRLLARDLWNITAIDTNIPTTESFDVEFDEGSVVEYFTAVTDEPLIYSYSTSANTDNVLAEKLAYVAKQGSQLQNCATASMKYAAQRLGKEPSDMELAQMVAEPNGTTSLYALKQFAEGIGLHSRAVKTDLDALKALSNCQIILYIPSQQHFVVLEGIDDEHVGVVDLAGKKFYYQTEIGTFDMAWPDGIALLLSNEAIAGGFTDIDDGELLSIVGASGYTCTNLLQEYDVAYCEYIAGECMGYYTIWWERWGCEAAESGTCPVGWYLRYSRTPCIEDPYNPFACIGTGDWIDRWMRACA